MIELKKPSLECIELFKAYWKNAKFYVTLKKIRFHYLENLKSFYKLSYHQNILSIFGFTKEPNSEDYFLVTEYANGGNLRKYLKENYQKLSWHDKMKLAIDLTSGLQCIHSHYIAHLTLNPYNVFVHNNKILIGDSTFSRSVSVISIPENLPILPYIEPNFISNSAYPRDNKSDIYSLGFIMYEISSGKAPFASVRHNFELNKKLLSGVREKAIVGTPIEYIDLYEQCWDDDPMIRPSADDVLARLGRMNLSPVYEDTETDTIKINMKNVEKKKVNVNPKETEVISESSSRNRIDTVLLDFGGGGGGGLESGFSSGTDSGFGSGSRDRQNSRREKKERKCQILPCLPKCRVTFGVFLCWMCVILVIACVFLGFFVAKLGKKQ
ncbi:kinase-like domain-containing protein [Glomus cerebriforme]|uniref:Kinase-like domain-containing protein n=1 Tax=Glomus cerebriforme TaxID=658196 RepID=A0A397S8D3_9GLOM|nr:kinase-like domain-containing protein [Glomus cerebriforme]